MSIEVFDLCKKYEEQEVLKNISFKTQAGQIVALLGPNGAGKSTTMKIINGYLKPDSGTVKVSGINVIEHPLKVQKKIGYLPEHNPLYLDLYVYEYLEFIASIHQLKEVRKKIDKIVQTVGLQKEANKKIEQLSKGYRQRVGIASALLHDPEILILDEPTSGLDPNQVVEIRNLIKQLGQEKTIIFSTHILQEVEAVCDHLILLQNGQIVENDSLKKIKNKHTSSQINALFKKKLSFADFDFLISLCYSIEQEKETWIFKTTELNKVNKLIMKVAMEKNWELESIYHQQKTLENIFSELTLKKAPNSYA